MPQAPGNRHSRKQHHMKRSRRRSRCIQCRHRLPYAPCYRGPPRQIHPARRHPARPSVEKTLALAAIYQRRARGPRPGRGSPADWPRGAIPARHRPPSLSAHVSGRSSARGHSRSWRRTRTCQRGRRSDRQGLGQFRAGYASPHPTPSDCHAPAHHSAQNRPLPRHARH